MAHGSKVGEPSESGDFIETEAACNIRHKIMSLIQLLST